jgi:toxin ParE1/3/4
MKIEYSRRAVSDLRALAADSHREFGEKAARAIEARIRAVIERIRREPLSAQAVTERPGVHVVPLVRYPYKIFYRVTAESVRIVHIRHTSRRPW